MRRLEGAGDNSSCQSKTRKLGNRPATRIDAARMLKRRLKDAGLSDAFSPHSFRATGITHFLENGGTLEVAQRIAGLALCTDVLRFVVETKIGVDDRKLSSSPRTDRELGVEFCGKAKTQLRILEIGFVTAGFAEKSLNHPLSKRLRPV